MMNHLPDSGNRESFSTGMVREPNMMRGRFDLVSPIALAYVCNFMGGINKIPVDVLTNLAIHYERGAEKYEPRNWEKGGYVCRYLNSAIRHCLNYVSGCRKEDHLSAALWNCFSILHTVHMVGKGLLPTELNDVPEFKQNGLFIISNDMPPIQLAITFGFNYIGSRDLISIVHMAAAIITEGDSACKSQDTSTI